MWCGDLSLTFIKERCRIMKLNHLGSKKIEFQDIILDVEQKDYVNKIYELFNDKDICDKQGWIYYDSLDKFSQVINDLKRSINDYNWIVYLKDSMQPVGIIGVHTQNELDYSCEIGYGIHPDYQNHGYATEALKAVTQFLINEVGFNRVVCKYREGNNQSKKVMEKAGFTYEGCERQARFRNNKFLDLYIYSFIKDDI